MIKLKARFCYIAAQLFNCKRRLVSGAKNKAFAFCSMAEEYEKAVTALNLLQTNAATIATSVKERGANAYKNPIKCLRNLKIVGVEDDDLNKLNVVHVSGTKGKGSTCALVESMLRSYGYKTGLYTSPHLIEVRERIRINGKPISKERFSQYFWTVYNKLKTDDRSKDDLPAYFAFLTVLAFKVFVEEKVDVAILEVGIGGSFDQTNVVSKPVVVGVASLGFDHTNILGTTIEGIASSKAGIFRKYVPAFTVEQSYSEGLKTLAEKAEEIKCPLYLCPPLSTYSTTNGSQIYIGIEGEAQTTNTSLALQLCNQWLNKISNMEASKSDTPGLKNATPFVITDEQLHGIKNCKWPGRCQIVQKDRITYFLDGAHTFESIEHCAAWFNRELDKQVKKIPKILLFNSTGERNVESLMKPFTKMDFDAAVFSTNTPFLDNSKTSDLIDNNADSSATLRSVTRNRNLWRSLTNENVVTAEFLCISEALKWIEEYSKDEIQVLVTGSLRLVGGVLRIIEPELNS